MHLRNVFAVPNATVALQRQHLVQVQQPRDEVCVVICVARCGRGPQPKAAPQAAGLWVPQLVPHKLRCLCW
jgi:hypothetical protein